jgi:hypothetical protein
LSKTGLTNGSDSATKRNAELGCGTASAPAVLRTLNWPERDLPGTTTTASGRAGWLVRSQQGGGAKKFAGIDATCDGQHGIACACSGAWAIRPWHCAGLWAASIASPPSAHRAILIASISDNAVRAVRCKLMQRYSHRRLFPLSVTWVTPRWFDGPLPQSFTLVKTLKVARWRHPLDRVKILL